MLISKKLRLKGEFKLFSDWFVIIMLGGNFDVTFSPPSSLFIKYNCCFKILVWLSFVRRIALTVTGLTVWLSFSGFQRMLQKCGKKAFSLLWLTTSQPPNLLSCCIGAHYLCITVQSFCRSIHPFILSRILAENGNNSNTAEACIQTEDIMRIVLSQEFYPA